MLERLYVHNFKCLVNFDLRIGPLSLFLGPNGSGKSALLEALRAVQTFVSGEARVPALFRDGDRTRCGFHRRRIRSRIAPAGRGAGEQFVHRL